MRRPRPNTAGPTLVALLLALAPAASWAESNFDWYADHVQQSSTDPAVEEGLDKDYTSPLEISGAEFRSDGLSMEGYKFWWSDGGPSGSPSSCLIAPVYLPRGANVIQLAATLYDNDATNDVTVYLMEVSVGGVAAPNTLASVSTTGQPGLTNLWQSGLSIPTDTWFNAYYLTTCVFSSSVRVISTRIWYN